MREIKFRGKRLNGKLKFNKSITRLENGSVRLGGYAVIPETVGQFTGLTDKNGVEIYETDIIRKQNYRNGEFIEDYIVVFDFGSFCLKTIRDNEIHPKGTLISFGNFEQNGNLRKEYVIGNIYDNPELL